MENIYSNMVTNFKKFESINIQPKVGDYVIADRASYIDNIRNDVFHISVGKLINIYESIYEVEYILPRYIFMMYGFENKTRNGIHYSTFNFRLNDIKYNSKDKEELEAILASKKYNL